MNKRFTNGRQDSRERVQDGTSKGFTLTELLVVIATVAILVALVLPALAASKTSGRLFQCLNNQKRMAVAVNMYADDFSGKIIPYANGGGFWDVGLHPWTYASTKEQALELVQAQLKSGCPLYPYDPHPEIYHCPSDMRMNNSIGSGWAYDSYSKTQNVTGDHHGSANDYWGCQSSSSTGDPTYSNVSQITSPSQTFVFSEDSDSRGYVNGSWVVKYNLNTTPGSFQWVDPVTVYHGAATTYGFMDGHASIWHWHDSFIINYGRAVATGRGDPGTTFDSYAPHSGPDYNFIHDHYRFTTWK